MFSLITHLAVSVRIKIYKHGLQMKTVPLSSNTSTIIVELLHNKKKSMLIDLTVLITFFTALPIIYFYGKANQVKSF